jgi:p-cumate 2,3-dioxygenase beta subunit
MTRAEAEDFLYHEAALLDAWKLDEWLALLTPDAVYRVPSNDSPQGDPQTSLYLIADDYARIKGRVVANVRVAPGPGPGVAEVQSNFTVHRFRRGGQATQFVGRYHHRIRIVEGQPRIALREAILDAEELGTLGAVSFIL